jgi:hypothetical protein
MSTFMSTRLRTATDKPRRRAETGNAEPGQSSRARWPSRVAQKRTTTVGLLAAPLEMEVGRELSVFQRAWQKGTRNRATEEARVAAQATGILPLDYMLDVMRDVAADQKRRDAMAMAAAPYLHPKLNAIDAKPEPVPERLNRGSDFVILVGGAQETHRGAQSEIVIR